MESRGEGVLDTLVGIGRKNGKGYCYPSQKSILELMKRFHNMEFSRRTLNRELKFLELEGYIKRVRRHRRGSDGRMKFASTLYKFTGKLFNLLVSKGKALKRLWEVFRVPKLAQYQSATAKHLPFDATLSGGFPGSGIKKEGASAPFSSQSPRPEPWRKLLEAIKAM